MKTTKAQMTEYLIDCMGYDYDDDIKGLLVDYRNDLESYLRDCGADDTAIDEVSTFFK